MAWRRVGVVSGIVAVAGGCGGGGQEPDLRRTYVVPHVFEQKGRVHGVAVADFTGGPGLATGDIVVVRSGP
jgi:hypothetical protein